MLLLIIIMLIAIAIIAFVLRLIFPNPVKDCTLYKEEGCAHVDGMLCDFPKCCMYREYVKEKEEIKCEE